MFLYFQDADDPVFCFFLSNTSLDLIVHFFFHFLLQFFFPLNLCVLPLQFLLFFFLVHISPRLYSFFSNLSFRSPFCLFLLSAFSISFLLLLGNFLSFLPLFFPLFIAYSFFFQYLLPLTALFSLQFSFSPSPTPLASLRFSPGSLPPSGFIPASTSTFLHSSFC